MKQLVKGIFLTLICTAAGASTNESRHLVSQFITSIQCKTFSGRLISTCQSVREKFGPPVCLAQTLQIDEPVSGAKVTLLKARDARNASIARHVFHWKCFTTESNAELLGLEIVDIANSRDEDVWLFNQHGKRLSKKAESKVFRTPAWRSANSGDKVTKQGTVELPAINE